MDESTAPLLSKGTLVRYLETTARWYFATVHTANPDEICIELFWGERKKVAPPQVQCFAEFMARRTKSLFMDRSDLCQRFFGESLLRLREDKFNKMRTALRKYGYSFRPEVWPSPGTRVYIWSDNSIVEGGGSPADRQLAALLPHWLDPQKMPPGSRDPLGLQGHAERIANKLLPGLTVTTTRIGYYGFLCWAIQVVNSRQPAPGVSRREMLNRLERALVLSEFVHHGAQDNACRLVGHRSRTQVLQSAVNGRYNLPARILKNQNTAGALRLYATSLVSMRFLDEATDLAVDGRLPWALTSSGRALAQAFTQRVPEGFVDFALDDAAKLRDTLRSWGRKLCLSNLRTLGSYRDSFLTGFLRGNSEGAEIRFSTVRRLFKQRLLTGEYGEATISRRAEAVSEGDVDFVDDGDELFGLSNGDVLLDFYEEAAGPHNADFQEAAVYEFIGLGLASIFHHVVRRLENCAHLQIAVLQEELTKVPSYSKTWLRPQRDASRRVRSVRELVDDVFANEDNPSKQAVIGAELLLAVARGATYKAVKAALAESPIHTLFAEHFDPRSEAPLAESYPLLVGALVERHADVSINKGRQRWCYVDGDKVVRDDLQPMNLALHAVRFPQLYALCADLNLQRADLARVD